MVEIVGSPKKCMAWDDLIIISIKVLAKESWSLERIMLGGA